MVAIGRDRLLPLLSLKGLENMRPLCTRHARNAVGLSHRDGRCVLGQQNLQRFEHCVSPLTGHLTV